MNLWIYLFLESYCEFQLKSFYVSWDITDKRDKLHLLNPRHPPPQLLAPATSSPGRKKYCLVFFHYTPMLRFMVFSYKEAFKNRFPQKNFIQYKSLANEMSTSFIFQLNTNQFFLYETHILMWENNCVRILSLSFNLKSLPLEMCHIYPCFQQGAPYPSQTSSTSENGSVAERRDNW